MSAKSKIEWCDDTWNPVLGCSKISPGCTHCYAMSQVYRMAHNPNPKVKAANEGLTVLNGAGLNWTGKVRLIPERLEIPLRTRKPTTYFVNSLSDLFHESLDYDDTMAVLRRAGVSQWHRFQVLTKRADRMEGMLLGRYWRNLGKCERADSYYVPVILDEHRPGDMPFLPNVWLGVSVESRDYLSRIDCLRRTPAAVRFLSLEPLLEDLGTLDLTGIHWVIVGGESGPNARPMHPQWVRNLRDQCVAAGVPFFFKQHGNWVSPANSPLPGVSRRRQSLWLHRNGSMMGATPNDPVDGWVLMSEVGKKKAGRALDGRTWDEMPAY